MTHPLGTHLSKIFSLTLSFEKCPTFKFFFDVIIFLITAIFKYKVPIINNRANPVMVKYYERLLKSEHSPWVILISIQGGVEQFHLWLPHPCVGSWHERVDNRVGIIRVKRPLTISKRGKKGLRGVLACAEAQRGEERGKKDYRKERTIESFTFVSPNSPVVRIYKIYYGFRLR